LETRFEAPPSPIAKWFKVFFTIAIVAGLLYFLSLIGNLVKLVVLGGLLAYILDPVARMMEARGLSRNIATTIIFLSIVSIFVGLTMILLPHVTRELSTFREGISAGKATVMIANLENVLEQKLSFAGVGELNLFENFQSFLKKTSNKIYGYFLNVVGVTMNLFIIPFMMFFLLKDGREIIKQFISLVPNRYFEFSLSLFHKTDTQLGGYLRGQFVESLIIGTLSSCALWSLDVKYFVLLGVLAGLLNLVPFIGPLFGAIPPVIVALMETGDLTKPAYVALAFLCVQIIDNAILKPVVVGKMVSLHPIVVLMSVLIGGKFFGIFGMVLSIPVVGIGKLVLQEAVTNVRKYRFS
jgi:putative permease